MNQDASQWITEDEIIMAFECLVQYAISNAKKKRLIRPESTTQDPVTLLSGSALCLYHAILNLNPDYPSVPLPTQSGINHKRLDQFNCPPMFRNLFERWVDLFLPVHKLSDKQRADVERAIFDLPLFGVLAYVAHRSSQGRPAIYAVEDLAIHLRAIAQDIIDYLTTRFRPAQAPTPPDNSRSVNESTAHSDSLYSEGHNSSPEMQRPHISNNSRPVNESTALSGSPYPGGHNSSPEMQRPRTPILDQPKFECPAPHIYYMPRNSAPGQFSNNSGGFTGNSIRGAMPTTSHLANRNVYTSTTLSTPTYRHGTSANNNNPPSPVQPATHKRRNDKSPTSAAASRSSNLLISGNSETYDGDGSGDPTSRIADMISSQMSISEVMGILHNHGCRNLTRELDLASFAPFSNPQGGYGDVYFGKLHDSTRVAVKTVLRGRSDEHPKHLKASLFRALGHATRELYTWSKCKHPNVADLLGLAEFRGQIAMVSGWMESGDLRTYVNKHPDIDRLKLCTQVANGLAYLHSIGIIHGDLKGPNVLISNEGVALVIDFGNAVLNDSTLQFSDSTTSRGTTVRWTAPEVLDGGKHSPEADVYALGMTILEAFTGKVPYFGKNDPAVVFAIIKKEHPARPQDCIPMDRGWGNDLWDLLVRCWNHEPE